MKTTLKRSLWIVACVLSLTACSTSNQSPPASGRAAVVERLDVGTRRPAFGGQRFGESGSYELLAGIATVRVDARHPANKAIVDLASAADADGLVRFRTDVVILRPTEAARASRVLIVDIPNRGNKLALSRLSDGGNQLDNSADAGNGWAMRQGHTLAWIGWQGDVPLGKGGQTVGTDLPIATAHGQAITGRSLEEFVFDNAESKNIGALTYPANSSNPDDARLSVRARPGTPAATLPSTAWRFLDPRRIEITRAPGFDAGAIYEFEYTARDPKVMGLGFAAMRDVAAFLKSGRPDAAGQANPMADLRPSVSVLMGISQSGRFLRDFVWLGFNAASDGGRVFDAAMPLIAGSRKSFVNARFAQPGRYSRQHEDHLYPGDQFPFSYATSTDPVSGAADGIFARCERDDTCPRLMHLDSNLEFWQARASLVTTQGDGGALPLPSGVRAYLIASTQHGPASQPVAGICQHPNNPSVQGPLIRAAMARLVEWARDRTPPPASRYPAAGQGLAPLDRAAMGFPDLSALGIRFPEVLNELSVVEASGPPWRADPARRYRALLPRTDADGHDMDGVRLPDVEVPLATYSGWNLRKAGFAENDLCGLNGISIPFAKDAAERTARRDPRPSIAERYRTRTEYVHRVKAAADNLRESGFMLDEDVQRTVERARMEPRVGFLPE
ncbi:hypothetical protein J7E70_16560 [Variovorax paradoxus]|nr:hypothetical protein [Variovorax paradoxus]